MGTHAYNYWHLIEITIIQSIIKAHVTSVENKESSKNLSSKWAPSNVALTQVLVAGALLYSYEQLYLPVHVQGALVLKVVTWTRESV